jgi:hypothetical protein
MFREELHGLSDEDVTHVFIAAGELFEQEGFTWTYAIARAEMVRRKLLPTAIEHRKSL